MAEARVQWNVFVDMEDSMKGGNDLIFMLTINWSTIEKLLTDIEFKIPTQQGNVLPGILFPKIIYSVKSASLTA